MHSTRRWQRRSPESMPLFDQAGGERRAADGSPFTSEVRAADGSAFESRRPVSNTSHAAAASIEPHAEGQRERVLGALRDAGPRGLTSDELEVALQLPSQSVTPRVLELRRAGVIVNSGTTRATRRGRQAAVYRVME